MTKGKCQKCGNQAGGKAVTCPACGSPLISSPGGRGRWGFRYTSEARALGLPLVDIAFGRDPETGKVMVARGILAVGQFAFGVVTVAQVGVGLLFGFGQVMMGFSALAQFAIAWEWAIGQLAVASHWAIGQIAVAQYALGQKAFGRYIWDATHRMPEAVRFFNDLYAQARGFLHL